MINSIQTSDIRNLFNPENIYISKEGGGAGNNWASGYTQGEAVQETLLDMFGARACCARGGGGGGGSWAPESHRVLPAVHRGHGPGQRRGADVGGFVRLGVYTELSPRDCGRTGGACPAANGRCAALQLAFSALR